jgi:uncharacterized phage protein gp47/JayE
MSKTRAEILANMRVNLGKNRPDLESTEGTVVSDIFEPIADEAEDIYVDIEHNGVLGSFRYFDKMSKEELNDLAFNYGLTRNDALKSSGSVFFRTSTVPTKNILIPEGTIVTTEPDERLQKLSFITTAERTMTVDNIADFYNATSGFYEVEVPIQALEAGESSNTGVGTIKLIEGSIPGINNVYNYTALTNGSDEESNEDLANRGLIALQGTAIGTEAAYISKMLENAFVFDALVVGPGDDLMVRDNGLGGKVDVYVKVRKNFK